MSKIIDTPKATITQLDDNIIYLSFKPDVDFKLEDAIEVNNLIVDLSGNKPFLSLVDVSGRYGNITNEARNHFAKDPKTKEIRVAEALIIDNLPMRLLARFYQKVNKPSNPIKIFSTKAEAIEWLKTIYNIELKLKNKAI